MSNSRNRGQPTSVVALTVAYDGRKFFGSQRQGDARTVQAELEGAIEEVFRQSIPVYLAGRTDRGVHAAGQVASFAVSRDRPTVDQIPDALNVQMDFDISVLEAVRKPIGFHARYSASSREYRYRVWTGRRNPFADGFVWEIRSRLNLGAMRSTAKVFVGEHDFASFSSGGVGVPGSRKLTGSQTTVRTIRELAIDVVPSWWGSADGELIEIRVVANGFLPRMVRGIVGSLVGVGRGEYSVAEIVRMLAARDRREGPMNAPPGGLTLWRVTYPEFA